MSLSKSKQAEWMREYRRRRGVIPKSDITVIPEAEGSVIPKLPWYAGAGDGIVRNRFYADRFLREGGRGIGGIRTVV